MTGEVHWIKITTKMFEDEKIRYLESLPEADSILIIWVKLLTLAGKINAGGYIYLTENIPYTEDMLAHQFSRPLNTVKMAITMLTRLKMIEQQDNGIYIVNWNKHQSLDGLEKIKEQNRLRQISFREKRKLLKESTKENILLLDKDIDIDIEKCVTCNVTSRDEKRDNDTVKITPTDTKIESNTDILPKSTNTKKLTFGEFKNVFLLKEEYEKLINNFGNVTTHEFIERLSEYVASSGKRYKNHYATILTWARKDRSGANGKGTGINQRNTKIVPGNEPSGAFAAYEERDRKLSEMQPAI